MNYQTLEKRAEDEFVEKKSRFIGYAAPVSTEEQALAFVREIKAMHPTATHHVYAYTVRENNLCRFSDDGEPHGTAGMPVLSVVEGNALCDCAVVVVRYFGGTLLGKGGLVRAYTEGAKVAVAASGIITMGECDIFSFSAEYALYERLLKVIAANGGRVTDTVFADKITVTYSLASESAEACTAAIFEESLGKITPQKLRSEFCRVK